MTEQQMIVLPKAALEDIAKYMAKGDFLHSKSVRFTILLFPLCFGITFILNTIMGNTVIGWPLIVVGIFAALLLIAYYYLEFKYSYKYYVTKELKYFQELIYQAEVRHEINKLEQEIIDP